jgi:hypothetical protein
MLTLHRSYRQKFVIFYLFLEVMNSSWMPTDLIMGLHTYFLNEANDSPFLEVLLFGP